MAHCAAIRVEKNPRTAGDDHVSPTPMANSANQSNRTPLSSFQKCVCLEEWWLVKAESDGKKLAVGGLMSRWNQAKRVFYSSPIIKRNDAYTLETTDGITVIIQGLINRARSCENGFPPEACNKFLMGFPLNWEVYADQYLGEESVRAQANSSGLDEFSTPLANCGNSDPPLCFDRLPVSRVLDCLIATHGSSDNDMVKPSSCTEVLGNFSANASRDSTLQNDLDMRNIIPFLMDACLLEETPSKHDSKVSKREMFSGDLKCHNVFEDDPSEHCSENTKNSGQEENRKTILSKESENFYHGSCGNCVDELFQGNNLMDKSNPSIGTSKHCSLQTAKRFISPCNVGKVIHKKTPNGHEMKRMSNMFHISKSINVDKKESCLNDKITSNSSKIGCTGVQDELFRKKSDTSNLKGGKNDNKKPKNNLKSGSMVSHSVSVSEYHGPDTVNLGAEISGNLNNSDAADVELEAIMQESVLADTSDTLCNNSEKTKSCTYSDINRPALQIENIEMPAPPVMGMGMQGETLTLVTQNAARASTRLRNMRSSQKKNQTSDHVVTNENVLSSPLVPSVSENDGSGYKSNAGSDLNASNLDSPVLEDLFVTERDDGFQEYEKAGNEILMSKLSMTEAGCCTNVASRVSLRTCDGKRDAAILSKWELNVSNETSSEFRAGRLKSGLKIAKKNLQERQITTGNVGIQKNEVSTRSRVAAKSSSEIKKNEVSPRDSAEIVPRLRGKLILTETADRHLECEQNPRNESLKRNLSAANIAFKGKVQAGSNVKAVSPSQEKGRTSQGESTQYFRRSSSRLKHSVNKQNQDQETENCLQIGKGGDVLNNEMMSIEHDSIGESASDLVKVASENRLPESSQEEVDNGQHEHGLQLDSLSCPHEVDSNAQKGLNISSKALKSEEKAKCFTGTTNVKNSEFISLKSSESSVKMPKSNDKAKGSSQKSSAKRPCAYQSLITRSRAQQLSFALLESLNFKRSRSGRLLVPPLENWRNQQIVYDPDGVITGITLGYDHHQASSASGNKQSGDSAVQQKLKRSCRRT